MASTVLKLEGSRVEPLLREGEAVVVRFAPAHVAKSEGIALVDASSLWSQPAALRIDEAEVEGDALDEPAQLGGGRIRVNSITYVGTVPVPLDSQGLVRLELALADGRSTTLTGSAAKLGFEGHARYLRHLPAG